MDLGAQQKKKSQNDSCEIVFNITRWLSSRAILAVSFGSVPGTRDRHPPRPSCRTGPVPTELRGRSGAAAGPQLLKIRSRIGSSEGEAGERSAGSAGRRLQRETKTIDVRVDELGGQSSESMFAKPTFEIDIQPVAFEKSQLRH